MRTSSNIYFVSIFLTLFWLAGALPIPSYAALPENYSYLSAQEKQEALWENTSQEPYEELPNQALNFWEKVQCFFGTDAPLDTSDERQILASRLTHRYGSVAKVRFISHNPAHSIEALRTGAPGMIRLSLAYPRVKIDKDPYLPGLALKLLADGEVASTNFFATDGSDGQIIEGTQEPDRNFFANDLTTDPSSPKTYLGRAERLFFRLAEFFSLSPEQTALAKSDLNLGNNHTSKEFIFKPSLEVTFLIDSNSHEDFRNELSQVSVGETLYTVYEKDSTHSMEVLVGSIILESPLIASFYGDSQLSFK